MIIDVHSHAIPKEALEGFQNEPFKYGLSLQEDNDGTKRLVAPSGFSFPVYAGFYDAETRVKDLDARNVDMEIVTPAPNTVFYDLPIEESLPFVRRVNDGIAALCKQAPDRLIPGGTLPMQDVPAACAEVERLVKEHGMHIVLVNTSVNGHYYDEPQYLPLFEVCERLDVIIFFHPQHNNTSYGLGPYYLTNILGNPVDTTVSATRLVLGGALTKYPGCKCLFAHGGGFLPYQRGRLEHGFKVRQEPKVTLGDAPLAEYIDSLYFDTITHSDDAFSFLISSHGADHIMLGSDYPFDMADVRPAETVLDLPGVTRGEKDDILCKNIARLIKNLSL